MTHGLVHPLLGRQLVSWGYDRDFGSLVDSGVATPPPAPDPASWSQIGLADDAVRVPAGAALDLGATGKAFAADLLGATLAGELRSSAIVSVGGDLAVARPDGDAWSVSVCERPEDPGVLVWLEAGGMATSSTRVRRWTRGGTAYHHVLDPRTGAPAPETWCAVTCVGTTAVAANTASTAAVVLGPEAPAWLERHDVSARLVATDRSVLRTGGGRPTRRPSHELDPSRLPALVPQPQHRSRGPGPADRHHHPRHPRHRPRRALLPRFVGQALHRNLALWSLVLLVLHVTTAVVDAYVDIRWWQALVPWYGASYLPLWLGLERSLWTWSSWSS